MNSNEKLLGVIVSVIFTVLLLAFMAQNNRDNVDYMQSNVGGCWQSDASGILSQC